MTEWNQVGTVEILTLRIYPIDPTNPEGVLSTEVAVAPGTYPVYRKADAYCWIMRGQINERNEKIGDGLFVLHGGDQPTLGLEVSFPSRTYGPEQLAEFLADPICQPGPAQRLRFDLKEDDWTNHMDDPELPPLEDDRVAMMLGLVSDKRTPGERLWDAIRTKGESLRYHYDDPT